MAELTRTYVVPLRRKFLAAPRYKRTTKAVRALVEFITRHMKAGELPVKITPELNMLIWEHGIRDPPSRVKVDCKKDDKEVIVQIHGLPFPVIEEEKKEGLISKVVGKISGKEAKPAGKTEHVKPAKPVEAKPEALKQAVEAEKKTKPAAKPEAEKKTEVTPEKKAEAKPADKPEQPKKAIPKAEYPKPAEKAAKQPSKPKNAPVQR